jgi:hypothetical protein
LSKHLHQFFALWDATVGMLLLYFQGVIHKCMLISSYFHVWLVNLQIW